MIFPTWFDNLRKVSLLGKFSSKRFCPSVKLSCLPAWNPSYCVALWYFWCNSFLLSSNSLIAKNWGRHTPMVVHTTPQFVHRVKRGAKCVKITRLEDYLIWLIVNLIVSIFNFYLIMCCWLVICTFSVLCE